MGLITQRPPRLQPPVSNAVWTSDQSTFDQVSTRCQNFISRYLERSLITPNDSNMAHVNSKLLELTFTVSNTRVEHVITGSVDFVIVASILDACIICSRSCL